MKKTKYAFYALISQALSRFFRTFLIIRIIMNTIIAKNEVHTAVIIQKYMFGLLRSAAGDDSVSSTFLPHRDA